MVEAKLATIRPSHAMENQAFLQQLPKKLQKQILRNNVREAHADFVDTSLVVKSRSCVGGELAQNRMRVHIIRKRIQRNTGTKFRPRESDWKWVPTLTILQESAEDQERHDTIAKLYELVMSRKCVSGDHQQRMTIKIFRKLITTKAGINWPLRLHKKWVPTLKGMSEVDEDEGRHDSIAKLCLRIGARNQAGGEIAKEQMKVKIFRKVVLTEAGIQFGSRSYNKWVPTLMTTEEEITPVISSSWNVKIKKPRDHVSGMKRFVRRCMKAVLCC